MSEINDTQKEEKIIDLNSLSTQELKDLQFKRSRGEAEDDKIITDTPEEEREKMEEAEPTSEYNVEIVSKPTEGDDGITVKGEQSVAKDEEKEDDDKKEELTYEQFTAKYPDLKDKVDETKFNEMFKVAPSAEEHKDVPVEYQKVTIDATDEVALTNKFDTEVKKDPEIKEILIKAGLKAFPKNDDEMDAFAEGFPRAYIQFEARQKEIAEDVTRNYIKEKEIKVNAPIIKKKNVEDFGNLIEQDIKELYPNIEKDKDTLKKVKDTVLGFYAKAKVDSRYFVNVNGELIPSREKLYTGFTNANRELYREVAQKGATNVVKAGDGKKIIEQIKKEVKASPMTTLQDGVKSSSNSNSRTVNVMDDNDVTALDINTLKAMRKKMQSKL